MSHEVIGTSACHCCGAWNAIIHYDNGEEEWVCECAGLPDARYTVMLGGSGAPVAYRDPDGTVLAKNDSHACHIWRVSVR